MQLTPDLYNRRDAQDARDLDEGVSHPNMVFNKFDCFLCRHDSMFFDNFFFLVFKNIESRLWKLKTLLEPTLRHLCD